ILATFFARGEFRHPGPDEFLTIANDVSGRDLAAFFDVMYRSDVQFDYAVQQVTSRPLDNGSTETTVVVRRIEDGVFPVNVRATFADGSDLTQQWDARDRWHTFRFRQGSALTTFEIDPEHVVTLDRNVTNNSWTAAPQAAEAAQKW